ncbi:MAG: N-acetylmuramoyl-L-alanine amidase [Bacteroidaceae bacterium]|nr:N-acetylmuramoyl-L-alanine amidase [Bacteroidaceae bacterium]
MKKRYFLSLCFLLIAMAVSAKNFTVVIDAGHGGKDPGAVSANGKVHEKDITLKVALMVGESIAKKYPEVKVLYTRKTDVFVGLNDRAYIANKANADLFISIHVNAAKNQSAKGAETYTLGIEEARTERNLEIAKRENGVILLEDNHEKTYANFNPNSPESYIIFEYMQSEFVKESIHIAQYVQENFANDANRLDRGVRQAGFLVLNATSMPSILVELGYISNAEEAKYLASASAQQRLSNCISKAFDKYYTDLKKLNDYAQTVEVVDSEDVDNTVGAPEQRSEQSAEQLGVKDNNKQAEGDSAVETSDTPVFKVQFLSSSKKLQAGDQSFKGLNPVAHYYDKGMYKYTYGASADYNEILRVKRKVNEKFKDAFIVAFVKGERVDTKQAIAQFHKNNL